MSSVDMRSANFLRMISTRLATTQQARIRHSCALLIVAFVLHTIVDPALTYLAVVQFEVAYETNPFMRQWLAAGPIPFILIHVPMYAFCGVALILLRWFYRTATEWEQYVIYSVSMIGFSGLICWGILLAVNGVRVLWLGM